MLCPLLARCQSKVNLDTYTRVCAHPTEEAYKNCDTYKRVSAETKIPAEWSRFIAAPLRV